MINSFPRSWFCVIASDPMVVSVVNFSRRKAYGRQSILCPFSHFCYASSSDNFSLFAAYLYIWNSHDFVSLHVNIAVVYNIIASELLKDEASILFKKCP